MRFFIALNGLAFWMLLPFKKVIVPVHDVVEYSVDHLHGSQHAHHRRVQGVRQAKRTKPPETAENADGNVQQGHYNKVSICMFPHNVSLGRLQMT